MQRGTNQTCWRLALRREAALVDGSGVIVQKFDVLLESSAATLYSSTLTRLMQC